MSRVMYLRSTRLFILLAATLAGCSVEPTISEADVDVVEATSVEGVDEGTPGVIEERLSDADTETKAACKKEMPTGSHVKRLRCKPPKDDSELIPLISEPRH